MSTNPRNPRYFPRMKVRGAHRRRLAPFQRMHGAFERISTWGKITGASLNKLAERSIPAPPERHTQ